MGKSANIRDVAQAAGVSRTTVSLVMNNSPIPSTATRERVFQAVKELNYQADPVYRLAQRRRRDRRPAGRPGTETIGFLTTSMILEKLERRDGYYTRFQMGIEKVLNAARFHLMRKPVDAAERTLPAMVLDGKVDGVIVEADLGKDLQASLVQQIPTVFLDRVPGELVADSVNCDYESAVHKQLDYLWNLGHRRIAALQPAQGRRSERIYLGAFHSFFEGRGVSTPALLPYKWEITLETHAEAMAGYARAVAALKERPTAIITWDVYAAALLEEFSALRIRVPEDISLIGMDDMMEARLSRPKLTSYRFPLDEMGAAATEMLLERIKEPQRSSRRVAFDGQLVERYSCAPPPTGGRR